MNRPRVIILLMVAVFLASAGAAAAAADRFTLAYKFAAGETTRREVTARLNGTGRLRGAPVELKPIRFSATLNAIRRQRVVDCAPHGTATLAVQFEKMTIEMKVGGENRKVVISPKEAKVTVNGSIRPIDGGKQFSVENMPLFGKEVLIKRQPDGEIVEGEDLYHKGLHTMMERVGFGSDESGSASALNERLATEEPTWLPDRSIMVGDTWERVEQKPLSKAEPDKRFKVVTKYSLDSVDKVKGERIARISYTSSLDLRDLDLKWQGGKKMQHARLRQITEEEGGVILWSFKRGRIVRDDGDCRWEKVIAGEIEHTPVELHWKLDMKFRVRTR